MYIKKLVNKNEMEWSSIRAVIIITFFIFVYFIFVCTLCDTYNYI